MAERMSPREFRARREALGLSRQQLATVLGNRMDTVVDWEQGRERTPIPYGIRDELSRVEFEMAATIDDLADWARTTQDANTGWLLQVVNHYQNAIQLYGWRWWRCCCVRAYGDQPIPDELLSVPESWPNPSAE